MRENEFEPLFKRNYRKLYLYALYLLGDGEISRDIVSEAFVYVWENKEKVRMESADSYLFFLIKNRCFDYLRHKRVTNLYSARYKTLEQLDSFTWDLYDSHIDKIIELIHNMPQKTRNVLICRYLNENTYKETSQKLSISVVSVKKHIMKGLDLIREAFEVKYKKGE